MQKIECICTVIFKIQLTHLKWLNKFITFMDLWSHAKKQVYSSTHSWGEADSTSALLWACPGMPSCTNLKCLNKSVASVI